MAGELAKLAVAGVGVLGLAMLVDARRVTRLAEVAGATVGLTTAQRSMVGVIREEAARASVPWLWRAAVANAYAESLLNPKAVGDGGKSIGLFQLHESGGGSGMSSGERMDPRANAAQIFEIAIGEGVAAFETTPDLAATTNRALAYWFAKHAENCARCGGTAAARLTGGDDSEAVHRGDLVGRLFPGYADVPASAE